MTSPIPQPPAVPFIGNVTAIDKDLPIRSFQLLAQQYGEIFQLNLLGKTVIFVGSHELVNEVSDESKFKKTIGNSLIQVRNLVGDGLFTAYNEEPNWAVAHRLLMPAFSTLAIRDMMEDMRDICDQLVLKWQRFGPEAVIDPSDDYTRVALDTIALCSMSYRLNSFYSESPPHFATAMVDFLKECGTRSNRPTLLTALMHSAAQKYESDIKYMQDLANHIVADRRANPTDKNDLLNKMLSGKDPKTDQGLSDDSITKNLLTFLIAGHETSSGTLSFVTYYLLKNPDALRKLRAEIDEVIGDQPAQFEDLSKMKYLNAVLRETLRLQPTAPARSVAPTNDTVIGNRKYSVKAGTTLVVLNWVCHRDPKVWGDDVNEFRPERMLDGKFEALPPNAWQPFGHGMRACIGRPFAWQEMQLVIASVFQKFDLSLVDPSYTLELKQALTIKPKDFHIRATLRADRRAPRLIATPSSTLLQARDQTNTKPTLVDKNAAANAKQALYVLYGSNTGTSESFAQRIASDAPAFGFHASLGTLDSATEHLPTDGPIIIITASFEGEPADNAAKFVNWIKNLNGQELVGVQYTVFGCGNKDWVQTYQRIPKLCDQLLEERGGKRVVPRGEGDAGQGNFFQVFDDYEANMWKILCEEYKTTKSESTTTFEVKTVDPGTERPNTLRQPDAALGRVVENRLLTKPGAPNKRHIEFELPQGATPRAGDYLAILPHNPQRDIHRVLAHFSLSEEQQVVISTDGPTSLPTGKPVELFTLLSGYVELAQPATTRDLHLLIDATKSESTRAILEEFSGSYPEKVLAKRLSILDILQKYPDIQLSLGSFLQMLPPMRVRQYSISSSPLWNPQHVTLTISVVEGKSLAENDEPFLGVASNYLANLRPGDRVQMAVRPSSASFHPPLDPMTPVVMFCAGSGVAPMRGFIQERAAQKKSGRDVTKMLLFFGCRSPKEDFLYCDTDFKEWTELGVLELRPAFSCSPEDSCGAKYVQDRIWLDKDDIAKAYHENAKFFACGSGKVATGIKSKLIEIIKTVKDVSDTEAEEYFECMHKERYATDIFD